MPSLLDGPESSEYACYVVTLCTGSLPMVLQVPFVDALDGISVFRSRLAGEGEPRYRLHVGYFDTAARALEVLKMAQAFYPDAWISSAPRSRLSSLNDTLNTAFQLVRAGEPGEPPSLPAAAAPTEPVATPVAAPPAAAPRQTEVVWPAKAAGAATEASSAPPLPESAVPAAAEPAARVAPELDVGQRYAVELQSWQGEAGSVSLPRLAVFREYHLYSIRAPGARGTRYALRLGFFRYVDAARSVAEHVRRSYPGAAVIPVSSREFAAIAGLAARRAGQPQRPVRLGAERPSAPASAAARAGRERGVLAAAATAVLEGGAQDVMVTFSAEELASVDASR